MTKPLVDWFYVTFDEHLVRIRAEPPGMEQWSAEFAWESIVRVCFQAVDILEGSDSLFIFIAGRVIEDEPKPYRIPVESHGGLQLWQEIIRRGLFDAKLSIQAAMTERGLFCWPALDGHPAAMLPPARRSALRSLAGLFQGAWQRIFG